MSILNAATVAVLLAAVPILQSRELGVSVEVPAAGLAANGHLRLPPSDRPARCVIVLVNWAMSRGVFESSRWREAADRLDCAMLLVTFEGPAARDLPPARDPVRNAAAGGAEALTLLLERFAGQTRRPELRAVPLLFWGFSAAGSFGTTYAAVHPARTIGVVRFQSHRRGLPVDLERTADVPHLLLAGGRDTTAGTDDAQSLWDEARRRRAPWTFVVQPGREHGEGLPEATELMLSWMAAVIRLRTGGKAAPPPIDQAATWHGVHATRRVLSGSPAPGQEAGTSWLPDEDTARLWRTIAPSR